MILYFIVSGLALAASIFLFFENIIISSASIVPIGFIGISILQAIVFKSLENEKKDHENYITFSTHEIDAEAEKLSIKYHILTKLSIIPSLCLFVIYFDSTWNIIFPICIYFLSFLPVRHLVKYSEK